MFSHINVWIVNVLVLATLLVQQPGNLVFAASMAQNHGAASLPFAYPSARIPLTGASARLSADQPGPIFTVNTLADDTAECTETYCTLRGAITAANSKASDDTILFDVGDNQTLTLTSMLPGISSNGSLTIDGETHWPIISGNNTFRVLTVNANNDANNKAEITLSHITVTNGLYSGGDCSYSSCGGGLKIEAGATVNLTDMVIRNSRASGSGGGIFNAGKANLTRVAIQGNTSDEGGGILNYGGTLNISSSVLANNTALYGGGVLVANGSLSIKNSTLSGNTATGENASGGGGAIDQYNGQVEINYCTIANNTAVSPNQAKSGIWLENGTLVMQNSIVANNGGGADNFKWSGGVFNSLGYNLANAWNSMTTTGTDLTGDPGLRTLADNGGPTLTYALMANSPAINQGNPGACLSTDQRGQPRTEGACDIGAYELNYGVTDISLSKNTIPENQPGGSSIGTFSATDNYPWSSQKYGLVSGAGDNDAFSISGDSLQTVGSFNFEAKQSYTIRVRSTDDGGLSREEDFTVTVTDVNEAPSLSLANTITALPENTDTSSAIQVAEIRVTDDALGANVLSLSGTDAAFFEISGGALCLKAGVTLDFASKPVLQVTVAVDDSTVGSTPDDAEAITINIGDTTAPNTSITAQPASQTNLTSASFGFSGSDTGSGIARFECHLDGVAYATCTSPRSYTNLSAGSHAFEVRAIDNAGNTDASPDSYTWNIDTTAPDTSITAQPAGQTNLTGASFSFSGSDTGGSGIARLECQLDGGTYATCTGPRSYTGLSAGSHTFEVRAVDNAGNTDASPASYTWNIDTTAPTVTINQASDQNDPTSVHPVRFTVVFSEPVSGFDANDLILSGTASGTMSASVTGSGNTYQAAVSGMKSDGTVVVSVKSDAASDAAGNLSAASTFTDNSVTYSRPKILFDTLPDLVTDEGQQAALDVTADAEDGSLYGQLTFSLVTAPAGAGIDPESGHFTWIPGENDGPASHPVKVKVEDSGNPLVFAEASFNITVQAVNDLNLSVSANQNPVLNGTTVIYTLTAKNPAPDDGTGLQVRVELPSAMTFVPAQSSALCASAEAHSITCSIGVLEAGTQKSISVAGQISSFLPDGGHLDLKAVLSAAERDPAPANNTVDFQTDVTAELVAYDSAHTTPGNEWSKPIESTTPSGRDFLGEFNNEEVALTLNDLPTHQQVLVSFDLFLIRSWDGNRVTNQMSSSSLFYPNLQEGSIIGPDLWEFEAQSQVMLHTSFANWPEFRQAYPGSYPGGDYPANTGAASYGVLGYNYENTPQLNSVYSLRFTLSDSNPTLVLKFRDLGLQPIADESWGLANIQVHLMSDMKPPFQTYVPVIQK